MTTRYTAIIRRICFFSFVLGSVLRARLVKPTRARATIEVHPVFFASLIFGAQDMSRLNPKH